MSLGVIVLLVVVGTVIWVGVDASRRDWGNGAGTGTWVIGCILLWIVVFPVYLAKRGKAPLKDAYTHTVTTAALGPVTAPSPQPAYRECPHCKEPMRRDASVCPHCRNDSTPWEFHDAHWWYRESQQEQWRYLDEQTGNWTTLKTPQQPLNA
jgi:hypothetical protein